MREVCFANIGPLRSGCVQLSKLTVITGQQNSGKTYLASLVYFAYNEVYKPLINYTLATAIASLIQCAVDAAKSGRSPVEEELLKEANERVTEAGLKVFIKELSSKLSHMLPRYFAYDRLDELINRAYADASVKIRVNSSEIDITLKRGETPLVDMTKLEAMASKNVLEITRRLVTEIPQLIDMLTLLAKHLKPVEAEFSVSEDDIKDLLNLLGAYAGVTGVALAKDALYIPAERLVILPAFYAVISLLSTIHKSPTMHLTEKGFKIRTPVLDYISLISAALSRGVEGSLVGNVGKFYVKEGRVFYIDSNEWEFPVEATSSGVSQLVGLVLPIVHMENAGREVGLVIIEEPEVNLHADLHLRVADYVSELSRKTNVLVTTHSEYFLAGIGLNIRRGALKREDVKVYFLKDGTVRELKVNEEGDIELPETIAETIGEISEELLRW